MSLKSQFATFIGKSSYWFLHSFRNGGTSLPGKLTLAIDPDILKTLSRNFEIVIITGTNGKTLTTALSVKIVKAQFGDVLTNPSGSNMKQGIVTAFLTNKIGKAGKKIAILETDEANVPIISKYISPDVFILTNLFRDQMDRYGEIYTTYSKILKGIKLHPKATIIANGDEPIFNSIKLPNPIIYYGFDFKNSTETTPQNADGILCPICQNVLRYKGISYSNLGNYFCPNCSFKRPKLTYKVTEIIEKTPFLSTFKINDNKLTLHIGGIYNIYNALAAYSLGRYFDINPKKITTTLSLNDAKIFGRQEVININGKKATLILIKNPVGLDQVLEMISTDNKPFSLTVLLNANYADGIDTSWIWDGRFENLPLKKIPTILAGGERYKDIAFRLKVAGVAPEKLEIKENLTDVLETIKKMPTENVYILATYTAVLKLRKLLASKGYIEGGLN